ESGLRENVPSENRVRTVCAGVGTLFDNLDGEKRGKSPQNSRLLDEEAAGTFRVPAPVIHDASQEQEVPLQVSTKGYAQHPHVSGRNLRLDIERVNVFLHKRENRFPVRGAPPFTGEPPQPPDHVPGEY